MEEATVHELLIQIAKSYNLPMTNDLEAFIGGLGSLIVLLGFLSRLGIKRLKSKIEWLHNVDNIELINQSLLRLQTKVDCDRVYLIKFFGGEFSSINSQLFSRMITEIVSPGTSATIKQRQQVYMKKKYGNLIENLRTNGFIAVAVNSLTTNTRKSLEFDGIQSIALLLIKNKQEDITYAVGVEYVGKNIKVFNEEDIKTLLDFKDNVRLLIYKDE